MKSTISKIFLVIAALTAPLLARADVIFYEGFNYPNTDITNASGGKWINFSGNGNHDMLVNNGLLEVTTTGNAIRTGADDNYRLFSVTNLSVFTNTVQRIYASFTVICTNLPNGAGSYFAACYNPKSGTGGGFFGRVQAFTNGTVLPNTWRLGVTANSLGANPANGGYPLDLALNTPYQVVEELDPLSLQAATIWINPLDVNQTGSSPTETHYTSSDAIGASTTFPVAAYAFRQASSFGNGFWVITNLTLATTFAEAATNTWSTNASAPLIVTQPIGATNFVGATVTLAAIANGQGLGNLTYQWLQNGNPYPSGNGTNILTFPSAQTSDSGDYKLVVTTPFGLSVTSDVTHVSISANPVPPTFTVQPSSQTNYVGQSVTFNATVISPGNVTFTWYSNNVIVTDGVGGSGFSSSLTLNNVQTDFSGSVYKVAVTNDIVPNGVVSTNAVLTVLAPPVVSIAYLRTLIDPTTFVTTASPTQPYQVTGTVTSYTNTTTGNTASYYLQDATAGINIFATFGSDFRPNQGDVVTFTGVLSTFNATTGGLELYADTTTLPYTAYSIVGNNNPLPTSRVIPFNITNTVGYLYLNTNLLASRVTLTNVFFGTNAGNVLSTTVNAAVTVTNQSGTPFALQFYFVDQDTAGQTLPAYASSVTGNLIGASPSLYLAVTKWSDIETNIPAVPIPLAFDYSSGTVTFNWSDARFNLQWATNVVGPYTTIPGAATGFSTNTSDLPMLFFRLSTP